PSCTSSVYLYYDPDFWFLSIGTYSALREIAFTSQLRKYGIEHYYMGFYIHSCPKMVYKGKYAGSYLLCPESYLWFPVPECTPKLDVNKYSRFAATETRDTNGTIELDNVLVLYMRQAMPYVIYKALGENVCDQNEVLQYAKLVGRTCCERMLLYRS
ncbi:unnamed protein product, partial [Owenia fusiformis]